MKNKKGFTLIELLVVIAIIALLLSILIPSLRMAKEVALRVICSTNLKSFGVGLRLYAEDNDGKMIPNARITGEEYDNGIDSGFTVWRAVIVGKDLDNTDSLRPLQLGKLFSLEYIGFADVFYCTSAERVVDAKVQRRKRYYTEDIVKHMPPGQSGWGIPAEEDNGNCRSNYMYWTWEKVRLLEVANKPIVVDSVMRMAHEKSGMPHSMNALFSDGHVSPTLASHHPEIVAYTERPWSERSDDYEGFVEILRRLDP